MRKVYLDNAATTPMLPQVLEAMLPIYSEGYGNPSSIYALGRKAREVVDDSREKVASLLDCQPSEVVFTSGGTEADNLALKGIAFANRDKGNHIVTTTIEHHAVLSVCEWLESVGFDITYLPVDSMAMVDPTSVEESIKDNTILVSVMHANNEVGTIEPIQEIGRIARERGVIFHTDAVQTYGHIPTKVDDLNVDLLSLSAHKLYGPKGVGALYVRGGTKIQPVIHGGGQEGGLRSSTENVPGIVGLGVAAEIASKEMERRENKIFGLRRRLTKAILEGIIHTKLNGHPTRRLANNVNVLLKSVEGESVVLRLDRLGVCASTGSACSSPKAEASHVLKAMGLPAEDLHSSLRMTLGIQNTREDVDYAVEALTAVTEELRRMSPLYPV